MDLGPIFVNQKWTSNRNTFGSIGPLFAATTGPVGPLLAAKIGPGPLLALLRLDPWATFW